MAEALLVFKPEMWASTILRNLKPITGMRTHSDYSFTEEIKHGTKLHITRLGDTQIRNYVQGVDITFDDVNGEEVILEITEQRYFGKYYDDIDATQAIPGAVEEDMKETAKALALDADKFVAGKLLKAVEAGTVNKSASAIAENAKGDAVRDAVEEGLVTLYSNNVPANTKVWGELSAKMYSKMRTFITELATDNAELLKSGALARYNNVWLTIENMLPVKENVRYNFLRTGKAFAFAEQINKVKAVEKENGFGQKFKGLYVYGGVVVRPEEMYAIQETVSGIADTDYSDYTGI
jgi:hypothetical protein